MSAMPDTNTRIPLPARLLLRERMTISVSEYCALAIASGTSSLEDPVQWLAKFNNFSMFVDASTKWEVDK